MTDLPPAYVQWATTLAERPTWDNVPPPTEEEEGSIFSSCYRDIVLVEKKPVRKRKAAVNAGTAWTS